MILMVRNRLEQRNPYEGIQQRPWVVMRLIALDSTVTQLKLMVDTGSPCALVVAVETMARFAHQEAPDSMSNFGNLLGAWFQIRMPEIGLVSRIVGYGSEEVVRASKQSHRDFDGLVGLPLLRLCEYGGDRDCFWLREATR